ncbi:MAG: hypothetical protein ACJ786_24880 [Catenulispora sp.]
MTSRACRALLALALFLGAAGLTLGSARAAGAPAAKPVQVGIGSVQPQIPDFTDTSKTMTFSGQLRNTGSTALKIEIELRRSMVTARSELGSATDNDDYRSVHMKSSPKPTELAPGATVDWKISPTEGELFGAKTPDPGVYAIDVVATDSDGTFLGGQRTFVVWRPLSVHRTKKARVALLWPVVGLPGLTGQKKPNSAATPIVADPQASQQYKTGGRLDNVLKAGQQLPLVNWLLDPDILFTANALAGGYFVSSDGTPTTQGTDGSDAKTWYDAAHTYFQSQAQNCWNLPYADPDVTTLAHSGTAGGELLAKAAGLGAPATTGSCRQQQTVVWPADGQADAATLKAVQAANVPNQLTLLSSNVVSAWRSAHVSLPQSPNTLVYDTYLSGIFNPAPQQPSLSNAGVLAGQVWLAQTALADQDNTDRVLVAAPPRYFDPPAELVQAIGAMAKLPAADQWFGLDDLGKVLGEKAITPPTSPLAAKTTTPNLPTAVVQASSDSQKLYQALHSVMEPGHDSDGAVPFRPVATWWRTHDGAAAYSTTVYTTVVAEHALVQIGGKTQPLTLSGKSGKIPVPIVNQTNSTVRVYLHARSKGSVQLKVDPNQGLQPVPSGQTNTVQIEVQGEGNGQQVELVATLYTCPEFTSNCAYYPTNLFTPIADKGTATIPVKVSRIGIIALGLMIGSGVLLVALIGLRVYRAKRAQHGSAQDTMAS